MEVDGRPSAILPPIGYLGSKMSHDGRVDYHAGRPALPALDTSNTSNPRGPSPPRQNPRTYSDPHTVATATGANHSFPSFEQRRSSGDQSDPPSASAQGSRYSLPSIYEALGMDKNSPPASRNPSSASMLPRPSYPPEQISPKSHALHQQGPETASWAPSRSPYVGHIGPASPVRKAARLARGGSSTPPHSTRPNQPPPPPPSHIQQTRRYGSDSSTNSRSDHDAVLKHKRYSEPSERHGLPSSVKDSSTPSYTSSSVPRHPSQSQQLWSPNDGPQAAEPKKLSTKSPHGESVKRHLEVFDLEQALNSVSDASKQLLDFSEFYRQKAHQTQRSGPLPGSTPHIQEIDDMMENGSRIQDALNRIREVVVNQQAALAERSREQAMKTAVQVTDDHSSFHDDAKEVNFSASDSKRRRGRAAPPGRCHSCNRAETPEWRRGPDGARTLCNACGLHYAKLTRKMSAAKASSVGGSSLRPKAMDSATTVP